VGLWLCTFVVLTYGLYAITAAWSRTFWLNQSWCDGNETLSRNKIRIWPSELIKMLKQIWTEVIVIMGIKLLFWLLMASKNPCGITCNCWTKNELKTELDYFVKQYALGHFNHGRPCRICTYCKSFYNHIVMLSFGRGSAMAANSFANPKYINSFVLCTNCLGKT
jgi:hypothetical protein